MDERDRARELRPTGRAQLLPIASPPTATLPAVGAAGFPRSLYPPARTARPGAEPAACPSSESLRAFTRAARATAVREAATIDTDFQLGLRASDRAWWPGLYADWIDGGYEPGRHDVLATEPAAKDVYSPAVATACGTALLRRSIVVVVGPSAYSRQVSHLYFLDRAGRPLLYWQHT
jgi:hypothetical protein